MLIQEPPGRPWSKVKSDLFEFNGNHYLVNVDYYSKWIEIAKLDDLTSNNIICHIKSQFARYGIPDELVSDSDHQYVSSAFKDFSRSYDFVHTTPSPHYPQSNGEAERAVQTIESLLKKAQDPYKALFPSNQRWPSKAPGSPRNQVATSEDKGKREALLR